MTNETQVYLDTKINEYLKKSILFEKKLFSYREDFTMTKAKLQALKKIDPNTPISNVKEDIVKLQENHYNAFLLEQNLQHTLNVLIELGNMANVLNIDLNLSDDYKNRLADIVKSSSDLFMVNENQEVTFVDNEIRSTIEKTFNERNSNEELLKALFDELPLEN
jgi:hypothetical protein